MAHAANVHVFHVEFGINETVLTQALEIQSYGVAERIIKENAHTSFLDEGCYQRTPLHIVLCGTEREGKGAVARNFYLAKLLIQHGADVNLRVPETYFGSEYMSPGKTPMELLADYYISLTKQQCLLEEQETNDPVSGITISTTRGLIQCREECLVEICELIFIMLAHGGNPNIEDEHRMTLVHRATVCSNDGRLLQQLACNGGRVNALDIRGNSPLLALCDRFPFGEEEYMESHEVDGEIDGSNPYLDCACMAGKQSFLDYLLSLDDVKLDVQNRKGRTALFNCMARGDIDSALLLLQQGCNVSLRGNVKDAFNSTRAVSPLFVLPCSSRMITSPSDKLLANRSTSWNFLFHLIDSGYFTVPAITEELQEIIDDDFFNFRHLKGFGHQLLHLLFGGTTATLRQHCARTVFQQCFMRYSFPPSQLFLQGHPGHEIYLDMVTDPNDYLSYLSETLTVDVLERLIQQLQIPKDFLIFFEIELFREMLITKFSQFNWFKYWNASVGHGWESDTDDETSTDEDESDLEYW